MDILNNLKVDGTITATGDITDGSSNKLSKKLDKLTTGPTAGTYTSVTVNAEGQVTGGSNPTTLAGYGITDAVNTTGDQTGIAGAKTWTGIQTVSNDIIYKMNNVDEANPSNVNWNAYLLHDVSGKIISGMRGGMTATGGVNNGFQIRRNNSITGQLVLRDDNNGSIYATAPYRTYGSGNVNDIVTIGSLASNPSVVHTTGNEDVGGQKYHTSGLFIKNNSVEYDVQATTDNLSDLQFLDKNGNIIGILRLFIGANGTMTLQSILRKLDGTYSAQNLQTITR